MPDPLIKYPETGSACATESRIEAHSPNKSNKQTRQINHQCRYFLQAAISTSNDRWPNPVQTHTPSIGQWIMQTDDNDNGQNKPSFRSAARAIRPFPQSRDTSNLKNRLDLFLATMNLFIISSPSSAPTKQSKSHVRNNFAEGLFTQKNPKNPRIFF